MEWEEERKRGKREMGEKRDNSFVYIICWYSLYYLTSISFCWDLATKLFLLFTFFFLGTYAYHNLNKQIHKNKNLSEPLKNSQLFNGINSLGWIFMCLNLAMDLLQLYLFLMKRIGFSLLHMMNCVKNIIVEKWWDLLTGFIRESL